MSFLEQVEIGTGAWQWGDKLVWGFKNAGGEADALAAFEASIDAGVPFIDTAELYGFGTSEKIIGKALRAEREKAAPRTTYIASKILPWPWRVSRGQFRRALRGSLNRLGLSKVDLYQIHMPSLTMSPEAYAEALAEALSENLIGAAGVSNYRREAVIRSHHTLEQRGHALASNQVEYHLLNRSIERDGTMAACKERGVKIIAYSPLSQGLLTGKYTPENPPPGVRKRMYAGKLPKIAPLIALMREIGAKHGDKTPAQVALNWCICKGTIPIPGARNAQQVRSNAGAVGWRMTDDEVAALDAISAQIEGT
ncbi:MAG: aldo/keto reductase [Anaerolineae bacterium]